MNILKNDKKICKAEEVTKYILDRAYVDFVNPGKYAGVNFCKDTFNVSDYIQRFLFLSYTRKVPEQSLNKALIFGEQYWKELLNEKLSK